MKVLLDECLPRKLKRHLSGHDVSTVPEMGWAGVKNGALLRLMEPVFEAFITIDGNMQYQQNLSSLQIGIVVLVAPDNTLETLQPLAPQILQALDSIPSCQIIKVSA
jgi:hypothetical protein